MKRHIIYSKSEFDVKKGITKRKFKTVLLWTIDIILWPFKFIFYKIADLSSRVYRKCYEYRTRTKKIVLKLILVYSISAIVLNIAFYIYYYIQEIDKTIFSIESLLVIPILICSYLILKFSLWIYHFFIGERQLLEAEACATHEYVIRLMPKLLKIFGPTGVGKDTLMAGLVSILARDFKIRTIQDMELIKSICYIFDFEQLDLDLRDNYKLFLSASKEKLREAYLGTEDNPGMARIRKLYLKNYYIKKKITPTFLILDLEEFEENPITHKSKYVIGTGVNRKHFIQLVMYEYIEWWIRENIEQRYAMVNQPFLEDPITGLTAKEFSLNFIRTRSVKKKIKNEETNKKEEHEENILWPWKNRLVVSETECGSWYLNLDDSIESDMINSGIRDFKAYQRHFILDFYWFQVDQASDRTAKLFRELEHGYAAVLNRIEVPGGRVANLFLNIKLKYYNWRIGRFEYKSYKYDYKRMKAQTRINDYQELYWASSNDKYHCKYKRIKDKYKAKAMVDKYESFKEKVSDLKKQIEANKKNGHIIETVCISKGGSEPTDYNIVPIHKILNYDPAKQKGTIVTQLVFKTSDCERYDTRYMRNLAEKRAKNTKVEYAEIPCWPSNFKMTDKEIAWMGYNAAKAMFGISDKVYESMRYGDEWKKHVNKIN